MRTGTRKRVAIRRERLTSGVVVERRKIVDAPELEWVLQAAQIRALKAMPEYGRQFLLVGGMEAGRRSPQEAVRASATGLTAGHPDVTIFLLDGRCKFIENKGEKGRVSQVQKERHAALRAIGHDVVVVQASTPEEAAERGVALVRAWLAGAHCTQGVAPSGLLHTGGAANDNADRAHISGLGSLPATGV